MSDSAEPSPRRGGPFSFFFVKPTLGVVLLVLFLGAGLWSLRTMTREGTPDLEIPYALVTTTWNDGSPEMVEKQITTEIERKVRALPRVKRIDSISSHGLSLIVVEFQATADLRESMSKLTDEVRNAEAELPKGADKPNVEQIRVLDSPVVSFGLLGDVDDAILSELAFELERELERLPGVRSVRVSGAREESVSVLLEPARVAELGLSPAEVAETLQAHNLDVPLGALAHPSFHADLEVRARFHDLDQIRDVVVRRGDASLSPITLGDVGLVRRDLEAATTRTAASVDGGPFANAVMLDLYKAPGADTIRIVERVASFLERSRRDSHRWPRGVEVARFFDETELIATTLEEAFVSLLQAAGIVFVVLLFLLTWREALVAGLAVPVTLAASLGALQALGHTLNELTVVGVILALGLLVDVLILVMEGMHDGVFAERRPFPEAVQETVRRFALPAFAGQLTTVLALLPLFVIGGVMGKFIRVIPATIVMCLVSSFLVAFLIALPLSRAAFRGADSSRLSLIDRLTAAASERLRRWIERAVVGSRWRAAGCVLACLSLLLVSIWSAQYTDFELFPKDDVPTAGLSVRLDPSASLDDSERAVGALGEFLRARPEVRSVVRYVGRNSPMSSGVEGTHETNNRAGLTFELVPEEERDAPAHAMVERWRPALQDLLEPFPGAAMEFHIRTGGASERAPIEATLSGPELSRLADLARDLSALLATEPGLGEILDDMGRPRTTLSLRPRNDDLQLHGLSAADIASQTPYWMSAVETGSFERGGTQKPLDIWLGMRWPSRRGFEGGPKTWAELDLVRIVSPAGRRLSLDALADMRIEQSFGAMRHRDGERAVTVSATPTGRTATAVLAALQPKLADFEASLPRGYTLRFGGEADDTAETFASVPGAFALAVGLVFGVLALLFGRFGQPMVILAMVPLALVGMLLGFFYAGLPLSFPAAVGVIALVGIVVNDAIVMVETMNHHLRAHLPTSTAASRGAAERLRPIVSTTLTTIGGMVPLAMSDPGWLPLALAIIFGLLVSTALAFVAIPALFLLVTPSRATA